MIEVALFLIMLTLDTWLLWIAIQGRQSLQANNSDTTMLESIFIAILAVIVAVSWLGLILAEIGWFSLMTLSVLLALVALGLAIWLKWRRIPFRLVAPIRLDRYDILAVILAVLAGLLYARPAEFIIGGEDPGTYVNIGINIARTGAISIYNQTLADTAPEQGAILLHSISDKPNRDGIEFPGFYVVDLEKGKVIPQFFHAFSVWIAILYQIGGVHGALFTTPLFGWLSTWMLYLLGRRLIHPGAGVLAMALLAVNISQIWFVRNPFADIPVQFFLLSGFWMLALFIDRAGQSHPATAQAALLSGACFGLCHLVKIDVFVVPFIVCGFLIYTWLMGIARRPHIYFLASYLLTTGYAALHGYLFSLPYVSDIFGLFTEYIRLGLLGLAILVPLLCLVAWRRAHIVSFVTHLSKHRLWLQRAIILVVIVTSLYAYFVRPLRANLGAMDEEDFEKQGAVINWLRPLATEPQIKGLSGGRQTRTFIEEGMSRMGWYLTPMGVWLGIAGFLYWITAKLTLKSGPFLGGTFISAVVLFYRGTFVPSFFWAFKRFVPLVVPSFMLLIAFLLRELWPKNRSHLHKAIVPIVLGCFLLLSYVQGSLMFWEHIEWEGAIKDTAALAASLPEDAVLLFQNSAAGHRLGLPLIYIHGRDLFLLRDGHENNAHLRELIAGWHEQGRPVYWLTSSSKLAIKRYGPIELVDKVKISWPTAPREREKLPDHITVFSPQLRIYKIEGTDYTFPHDVNAHFGDQVILMGYKLNETEVVPGGELELKLYWQAQQRMSTDYTVFTHVIDEELTIWGQTDVQPVNAERPTSGWIAGEIVPDQIVIPVQPDTPIGTYKLQVGLYQWQSMERLPILDSAGMPVDDRLVLEEIQVVEPEADTAKTP